MNEPQAWDARMQTLWNETLRQCACGREHALPDVKIVIESGALQTLPALLRELGVQKPYLVMDENTKQAAGDKAEQLLQAAGIAYAAHCLPAAPKPQAGMETLALLAAAMEPDCDFVLGAGSGVLNDLCKMIGMQAGLRTGIVGTAPSMDGYASNSSAMIVDGVKTTIYNHTPALVLCDLDVLRTAPAKMRGAGIGDMAAKAISIAEWRISHLVTGEYYCDAIAHMMLGAYRQAVDFAGPVLTGEADAVRGLTEGLVFSGLASSMAQTSRPASGSEHTLSHLMDMLAIRRHAPHNLHGEQVGYGVRVALAAYAALLQPVDPFVFAGAQYNPAAWERDMRRVFGAQAETLMQTAQKEGRNQKEAVQARRAQAASHWKEIQTILSGVVEHQQAIVSALDAAGIPPLRAPQPLGITPADVLDIFIHAKDLRSRYIFPALVSDLGLMPWMRDRLMEALDIAKDRSRYFDS